MNSGIKRLGMLVVLGALMLALAGCSVFISTPRVACIRIQNLDNKFIEHHVNLDGPIEHDLGIPLTRKYTLQLDFEWLWNMDKPSEIYVETGPDAETTQLNPWMLCKYRF